MRSKTPLVLMEQLVMVLVFAVSAAFCLRIFILCDQISRENEAISQAALQAQNTAELLKGSREQWELVLERQQWKNIEDCWQLEYNKAWEPLNDAQAGCGMEAEPWRWIPRYRIEVQKEDAADGLCKVSIGVTDLQGESLIRLSTAWQEVTADE